MFRRHNSEFEERDTQVLGISNDARATQAAYASSLGGLPYPLLSDFHPKGHVSTLYGIYNEELGRANRSVFVIDKEGTLRFKRSYTRAADLEVTDILAEVDKL